MTSDDARLAQLCNDYYRKVVLYCRRRTKPDLVDDAVATTFLTAWKKIEDVPSGPAALPWLYAVAYRVLGHQYRTMSRQRKLKEKLSAVGLTDQAGDPADFVVMDHESRQVLGALSKLKPADQELLRLSVWEEMSSSEIAIVLGISEVAAKKRYTRARAALARSYQGLEKTNPSPAAQKGGAR